MKFKLIPLLLPVFLFACKKNAAQPAASGSGNGSQLPTTFNTFSKLTEDKSSNALFFYDATANPLNKKRGWQGCPSIGIENNHYIAAWFANEKDEGPGSYIVVAVSNDQGKTWKKNSLIIAPDDVNKRQSDQALWRDKNGILHLSWTTVVGGWDGGSGGVWEVEIKENDDNDIEITKPTRLFSGAMNIKPTFIGRDSSTILFPVSGWNIKSSFYNEASTPTPADINGALLYVTPALQDGASLATPERYSRIPVDISKRLVDEHMVFTTDPDGNGMTAFLRTIDGLTISKSTDKGITWTKPVAYADLGDNTASRTYVGKLRSGNILVVYNNSKYRTNLTARLSSDNGKTWGNKFVIEKSGDATYPDVFQNQDGEISLIYDRGGRKLAGEIVFVKFTEQDIIKNEPSKLVKTVIDKF